MAETWRTRHPGRDPKSPDVLKKSMTAVFRVDGPHMAGNMVG